MSERYIAKVGDIVSFCCGAEPGKCQFCGSQEYKIVQTTGNEIVVEATHRGGCVIPEPHCVSCNCNEVKMYQGQLTLRESYGRWSNTYRTDTGVLKLCGVEKIY